MELTATQNIDKNISFSGVKAHVERKYKNDSNKDIDTSLSYLNQTRYWNGKEFTDKEPKGRTKYYQKLAIEHYRDYVQKHDEKCIKTGHKERAFGSVSDYVKDKKTDQELVVQFANMDDLADLEKEVKSKLADKDKRFNEVSSKEFHESMAKIYNKAMIDYATEYNQAHRGLKITDMVTNVDEKGAPHFHARLSVLGHTLKGNPNCTLNGALCDDYGIDYGLIKTDKNGKKQFSSKAAMQIYRKKEDERLIHSFEKVINQTLDLVNAEHIELKLKRTQSEQKGRSMEEYKKEKANELDRREKELNAREQSIQQKEHIIENEQKIIEDKNRELKLYQERFKKLCEDVEKRGSELSMKQMGRDYDDDMKRKLSMLSRPVLQARQYMNCMAYVYQAEKVTDEYEKEHSDINFDKRDTTNGYKKAEQLVKDIANSRYSNEGLEDKEFQWAVESNNEMRKMFERATHEYVNTDFRKANINSFTTKEVEMMTVFLDFAKKHKIDTSDTSDLGVGLAHQHIIDAKNRVSDVENYRKSVNTRMRLEMAQNATKSYWEQPDYYPTQTKKKDKEEEDGFEL